MMLLLAILLLVVNITSFVVVFINTTDTISALTTAASATATGNAYICNARLPTVTISDQSTTVGDVFTLQVVATFYGANTSTSYFDDSPFFNINGSGYISFTPLATNVGSNNIIITVQDASNCGIAVNSTDTFSLTILAAGGGGGGSQRAADGGGGGGGGGGAPKKKIDVILSTDPQYVELDSAYDVVFRWAAETHTISISKIDGKTVTLRINSATQFITLGVGESQEVDLDEDKIKDISISLLSLENNIAKLKINIVREGIILSDDVLKVSLHQSQLLERKIVVVHDWMEELQVDLIASLEDLLTIDPAVFPLPVNSKQAVVLSFNPHRDAELGTYTGTVTVTATGKEEFTKMITTVFEVESDAVLLDGGLDVRDKALKAGDDLRVAVSVFNLLDVPVQNVTLLYEIFDQTNTVKYSQEEQINIEKQASFTKTIPVPKNLPAGEYVLSLKMIYADSFAIATEIFTIVGKEKPFALAGLAAFAGGRAFILAVPIMFVLIVGIVVALFLTQRKIRKVKTMKTPTVIKQRTIVKQKTIQRTVIKPKTIIKRDMSEYRRKLATLQEGYRRGYIKEDTYKKLKAKLEEIIKKGN